LLYSILKIWVRLAAFIFCRKIIINNRALLKEKGPLLLACNHPNSFLDAVILDILFEQPVWSLARGDAFAGKTISKILTAVKILPVYRTSEGVENLSENYKTFDACLDIFRNNGVVQIFSEGKCINEWHLRPLKKGTARLAFSCYENNIPLKVLPVAINYNSFKKFGKNIFISFGKIITKDDLDMNNGDGLRNQQFNNLLKADLEKTVFEIDKNDLAKKKELLEIKIPVWQKIILSPFALAGFLVHTPLYAPVKAFVYKKTYLTDHYDSVLVTILLITYPLYLLLITILIFVFIKSWWAFLFLLILPFMAWSFVRVRNQA
jgi:1-acyl-sn-glycerol-3-phosphate acyltransferase